MKTPLSKTLAKTLADIIPLLEIQEVEDPKDRVAALSRLLINEFHKAFSPDKTMELIVGHTVTEESCYGPLVDFVYVLKLHKMDPRRLRRGKPVCKGRKRQTKQLSELN
jgi:hypothetical protein